jgi:type I restriction enzyme S subunit
VTGRWPIPASWRWARAGELAAVVGGGTPRTGDPDNFTSVREGAIAWLTPADLAGHERTYVTHGARHLTPKGLRASAARLLPVGSVVLSSRAPIGRCAIAAAPLCTSQGFRSFVLRTPEVLPEYLHLYLRAATRYAHSLASGSTFKELSGSKAAAMWVPVAPTAEQARIVARVGAARARCARAQALLDGAPALLARLRHAILDAGLRGPWALAAVGDVARVQAGFAFKSAWYRDAGVRLLRGVNVAPQRTRWDDAVYLEPGRAREHSRYSLSAGDIVIAMDRPLIAEGLKVCRIAADELPCLLVQRVARLIVGDAVSAEYLYLYLQSRAFIAHLDARATGTQLPHVSADDIASARLPVPPLAEQREIVQAVARRLGRLARATQLHAGLRGALAGVEQAVLARAFRGELGGEVCSARGAP